MPDSYRRALELKVMFDKSIAAVSSTQVMESGFEGGFECQQAGEGEDKGFP